MFPVMACEQQLIWQPQRSVNIKMHCKIPGRSVTSNAGEMPGDIRADRRHPANETRQKLATVPDSAHRRPRGSSEERSVRNPEIADH
jgi:hypothetical protein